MIDLSSCIFIVDGQSEIQAFRAKFEKEYGISLNLRTGGCNGKDVNLEGYVNSIYGILIMALSGPFRYIACIMDRESRALSSNELSMQIKTIIVNKIRETTHYSEDELVNKVHVFSPDKCFENWLIADVTGIKTKAELIRQNAIQENYDGKSGLGLLKSMMLCKYKKTLHAPILFKAVEFPRARMHSASFCFFLEFLNSPTNPQNDAASVLLP